MYINIKILNYIQFGYGHCEHFEDTIPIVKTIIIIKLIEKHNINVEFKSNYIALQNRGVYRNDNK